MLDIHEVINNVKVETDYERAIFRALGMLRERAIYWRSCACCNDEANAYESAADILAFAMMEDWAALNNFDYYHDDVIEEWACTSEIVAKECEVKMWIQDLTKALYFLNVTEYKYTFLIQKIENNCVYFTNGSKCMLTTLVYAYDKYITTGEVMLLR